MTLTDEIEVIRTAYRKAVEEPVKMLRMIASDDGRIPQDWKTARRVGAVEAFGRAYGRARKATREWLGDVIREAQAQRDSEPTMTQAEEMRAMRSELRSRDLAEGFGTRTEAANHLLPEAERLLAQGNWREAEVYVRAAERAAGHVVAQIDGREVSASVLRASVEEIKDREVPHRREAVRKMVEGRTLHDALLLELIQEARDAGVGVTRDDITGDTHGRERACLRRRAGVGPGQGQAMGAVSGVLSRDRSHRPRWPDRP